VKIYIILLHVFLRYDMSCVCRLSVRNACTVAKRYVVGGRRWYHWIERRRLYIQGVPKNGYPI